MPARKAEVEDLEPAVGGDHQVRGLDVAVHDPAGVGLAEGVRHLRAEAHDFLDPQGAPADPLREGLPLDELLRDVERRRAARLLRGRLAGLVDGGDAGVREDGGGAGLAQEALARRGVAGVLGAHELQRDVAAEDAVARPVDDAHAARAEASDDVEMRDRAWLHAGLRTVRAATGAVRARPRA